MPFQIFGFYLLFTNNIGVFVLKVFTDCLSGFFVYLVINFKFFNYFADFQAFWQFLAHFIVLLNLFPFE